MPTPTTIPAAMTITTPGTSMAAILKRETEAQEKERQAKAAEQLRQQQQAAALLKQQQAEQLRQQQQQQEALRKQQQEAAAKQKQLQEQQQAAVFRQQQEAALRQQQSSAQDPKATPSASSSVSGAIGSGANIGGAGASATNSAAGIDIIFGLSGLSLNGNNGPGASTTGGGPVVGGGDPVAAAAALGNSNIMLQESFATLPTANEQDRARPYTPQNPYPSMPTSYPSTPSTLFENPVIFEKLGTDALFFIFYYKQGTYQQYLAARELKKQSWRFHKKYMTWFQRHEEPKVTTDEYEQGTYVYFDYETGWCTRIKQDFRFEYSFLEDSLQ
jgi:CCR4-NOT transcription complex subunit 3